MKNRHFFNIKKKLLLYVGLIILRAKNKLLMNKTKANLFYRENNILLFKFLVFNSTGIFTRLGNLFKFFLHFTIIIKTYFNIYKIITNISKQCKNILFIDMDNRRYLNNK